NEEPMDILIYYGEIYLKYIELTNSDVTEEDIIKEIRKLDGKGAVSMSILQKREMLGVEKGIKKGIKKGIQEGIEKGIQEGQQEEKIEIAKNLIKERAEIALVIKATGLSKSEVEKLKEKLNY